MTFNPNIPQANDIISSSQPQILTNFSQLNTLFGIDHVEYNNATAANRGKHTKITYVQQGADPATLVSELALYTKNVGGVPKLFIREQTNGTVYQLNGPVPSRATTGYSWLPGGTPNGAILIQWGQHITLNATTQTITFPTNFSAAAYIAIPTLAIAAGSSRIFCNVVAGSLANNQFQANTRDQNSNAPAAGLVLPWIAIGPG